MNKGFSLAVCPMQQNWMDLPNLLSFCNSNRMSIGFNTVVWPLKFSIKSLPQKEIRQIHKFLKDEAEVNVADITDFIIRRNYELYFGMLTQLDFWANEASVTA